MRDGRFNTHVRSQHNGSGGHQTTRCLVLVFQQWFYFCYILHRIQHARSLFGFDIAQQIGRFIRFHMIHDRSQLIGTQAFRNHNGIFFFKLFQNIGRVFGVQLWQQRVLFFRFQIIEYTRLIGRAQPFQQDSRTLGIAMFQKIANLL